MQSKSNTLEIQSNQQMKWQKSRQRWVVGPPKEAWGGGKGSGEGKAFIQAPQAVVLLGEGLPLGFQLSFVHIGAIRILQRIKDL